MPSFVLLNQNTTYGRSLNDAMHLLLQSPIVDEIVTLVDQIITIQGQISDSSHKFLKTLSKKI